MPMGWRGGNLSGIAVASGEIPRKEIPPDLWSELRDQLDTWYALSIPKLLERGWTFLISDGPEPLDAGVDRLNASVRALGHQHYFSTDAQRLMTRPKPSWAVEYRTDVNGWPGFSDYDDEGWSADFRSTLFFSEPMDFLLLRGGGLEPSWLAGPEAFVRAALALPSDLKLPTAIGDFNGRPDITEAMQRNRIDPSSWSPWWAVS